MVDNDIITSFCSYYKVAQKYNNGLKVELIGVFSENSAFNNHHAYQKEGLVQLKKEGNTLLSYVTEYGKEVYDAYINLKEL